LIDRQDGTHAYRLPPHQLAGRSADAFGGKSEVIEQELG
jgi:hypothetical protein